MGITEAIQSIEIFGPYAIIVFLGIAYWKKDKQNTELIIGMSKLIQDKTVSDVKLESALMGLRDVIMVLTNKLQ
ncbi:hypothetical protein LCGC14_2483740 [marine sediment metagenome]|uniref:Uncharacterized protein n=1 Tax=marine sediment metagenome TaxID=412755 RepID=A0A0F9E0I0_9ZZZZ